MKVALKHQLSISALVIIALSPLTTYAGAPKLGRTCGCSVDSQAIYGAGQDLCSTFVSEFDSNPGGSDVDASYGQSLGWIAGYMSAFNRSTESRDIYDMDLDYVAYQVAAWCRDNPEKFLSDAMAVLTDKQREKTGLLPD